jgi:hypothetical protein
MKYIKKLICLFLCLIIALNSISQINIIQDSINVEQGFKSKLRFSLGLGYTNIEQKVTGPATNITSNLNVLNVGFNSTYKVSERIFIEAGITSLIGSSFNYYIDNFNSISYQKNPNAIYQSRINSSFSILSSSANINASLFRNKPNFLFFIPNYFFIGPRYDAIIRRSAFMPKNYLGYQYGVKYKLGLKYSNIYPVVTISQTPNISNSGSSIISDITNRYVSFSLFIESKEGVKKFKKYTPPSNLKFTDIPLFRWFKKS